MYHWLCSLCVAFGFLLSLLSMRPSKCSFIGILPIIDAMLVGLSKIPVYIVLSGTYWTAPAKVLQTLSWLCYCALAVLSCWCITIPVNLHVRLAACFQWNYVLLRFFHSAAKEDILRACQLQLTSWEHNSGSDQQFPHQNDTTTLWTVKQQVSILYPSIRPHLSLWQWSVAGQLICMYG